MTGSSLIGSSSSSTAHDGSTANHSVVSPSDDSSSSSAMGVNEDALIGEGGREISLLTNSRTLTRSRPAVVQSTVVDSMISSRLLFTSTASTTSTTSTDQLPQAISIHNVLQEAPLTYATRGDAESVSYRTLHATFHEMDDDVVD
jgi:hypothetical protein